MVASNGVRIESVLAKHGYERLKTIGAGSFGKAVLVRPLDERNGAKEAVVKMVNTTEASSKEREDALRESKVLSSLRHPCVVRYRDNFIADGWLCIVMDYCEGGDLAKRVKKYKADGQTCPKEQVLMWTTQVLLALKYIHDRHILHRDLKSGNLFLSKRDNLKLGDFGISKVLDSTIACAHTQIGTPYYMSPELCSGEAYAWAADIWSLGCIVFEMCALRVPFEAGDVRSLVIRITTGKIPELPAAYAGNLQSLYARMLDRDPVARPGAATLLTNGPIAEMAKRMTRSVDKADPSEADPQAASSSSPSNGSSSSPSHGSQQEQQQPEDFSGTYTEEDCVEFYSETHQEWLPAVVLQVDEKGRVIVNLKPKTWLSVVVQATRVRPRRSMGEQPARRRSTVESQEEEQEEEQDSSEDDAPEIEQEEEQEVKAAEEKVAEKQVKRVPTKLPSGGYPSSSSAVASSDRERPPPLVRAVTPRRSTASSASAGAAKDKVQNSRQPSRESASALRSRPSSQDVSEQRPRRASHDGGKPMRQESSQPGLGRRPSQVDVRNRPCSQDRKGSAPAPKLTPRAAPAPMHRPPAAPCRDESRQRRGSHPQCVYAN